LPRANTLNLWKTSPIYAEIYNSQILANEHEEVHYDARAQADAGDFFKSDTIKPRNLSETLGRFGKYFGRFWYMLDPG
jgi:hypothetical protein